MQLLVIYYLLISSHEWSRVAADAGIAMNLSGAGFVLCLGATSYCIVLGIAATQHA